MPFPRRRDDPERDLFLAVIGTGLRRARTGRGWSQRKLAEEAGVDQAIISRLENGIAPGVRWDRIARILLALEWPVTKREALRLGVVEPPPVRRAW